MTAKMREVADRAGVSPATVSRVLNKTQYIKPETEKRVLDAVKELNYHKNVNALRLATGHSNMFGLVISEIANPFFPEVIRGFQAAAWEQGCDVLLCNTEYSETQARAVIRKLLEADVRGVAVMTSSLGKSGTTQLTAAGVGLLFCNHGPAEKLISNVSIDYQHGISQAIAHARSLGHRRAAILSGPKDHREAAEIRRSLIAGLKAHRFTLDLVVESNTRADHGASAIRKILALPEVPTVIFCGSDLIAMGAMNALQEAGRSVPGDISVIGIDDIAVAYLARPPLTTIRVPREQLGAIAFQALQQMLKSKRQKGVECHLQTELVIRRSTAPPAGQRTLVAAG
jgi:LacI family transcriptional regulator